MALLDWHLTESVINGNLDCYVLDSNISGKITLSVGCELYAHITSQQSRVMLKICRCLKEQKSTMRLGEISFLKFENRLTAYCSRSSR